MPSNLKSGLISFLRWTERYTKTDMVYLASAGFWSNLGVILQSLLSLALAIAFANFLTPTTYGVYQYLVSLSVLVAAVSLSGMNTAVTQAVARGYEGVIRAAVRLQLIWALVPAGLTLAGGAYYVFQGNFTIGFGLLAIAIGTPLVQVFNTYTAVLQGKRAFRALFTITLVVNVMYYGVMFIAAWQLRNAALLVLVNTSVSALGAMYAYRRTLRDYPPNNRTDDTALSYGKHLSVLSGFGTIMTQLDSVLVFHFLGPVNLANYAFATLLPERVAGLFGFIGTATLPKFANQPLSYIRRHLLGKVVRIALAGAVAALLYALVAPVLFHILFPRYLASVPYTQLYAPIIALLAAFNATTVVLHAKRFTREIYVFGFTQPALLVGLQIPLLLAYGILGMIIARIISEAIAVLLSLVLTFWPLHEERDD